MSYRVKWIDEKGISDTVGGINSLSEAIENAKLGADYYGDGVKTQITDEYNGLLVWSSEDSPELTKYLKLDHEQWQSLKQGHHEKSDKPSVYFDIDGTLGKWYTDGRGLSLEEMIDPANHYFRNIETQGSMVTLANMLHEQGVDVCIISAAYKDTIRDKWDWIKEHLPFIPEENICFAPIGADKTDFVKGNAEISILVDDYNKNLEQWKGTPIKALNGVNSHSDKYVEIDFHSVEKSIDNRLAMIELQVEQNLTPESYIDKVRDQNYLALFNTIKEAAFMISDQIAKIEKQAQQEQALSVSELDMVANCGENGTFEESVYDIYKKIWVMEHISPAEFAATCAAYENEEDAKEMGFLEYVEEYGFADGSCFASFDEFCDNELSVWEIACRMEDFLWERGEYDYPADDTVRWINSDTKWKELARLETVATIAVAIENEELKPVIEYLESEIATMDEADELGAVAEKLLSDVKAIIEPEEKTVAELNDVSQDLKNSVDPHEEITTDDGKANALLFLYDDAYKEFYNRIDGEANYDMSFEDILHNTDATFNAYIDVYPDKTVNLMLTVQSNDLGWDDYEVPLTDTEKEALLESFDKAAMERYGVSGDKLLEEVEVDEPAQKKETEKETTPKKTQKGDDGIGLD